MRRLGPADYRDMPWKNGGGTTRELWKWPHPTDPSRFLARLSIATVAASGPFSIFPGIDRILLLLEGEGMALTRTGAPRWLPPDREAPAEEVMAPTRAGVPRVVLNQRWQCFAFPGEAQFDCELLGGPVRDFNLMFDRTALAGSLEVLRLEEGESRTLESPGSVLLHGLEGRILSAGEPLAANDTLWWEHAPERLELHGEAGVSVLVAVRLCRRA